MFESETALIDAMVNKDDNAYRHAVRTYQGPMINLAGSIVGNKFADEVVQEAWFSVLKALPKFQKRSSLKTWLLTIVANEAKGRLRKEKRMTSLEAMTGDDPEMLSRFDDTGHWSNNPITWKADSPDALLSTAQFETCLNTSIDALPWLQGATLNLKERQGHSLKEICKILEVSESNVRVLLHRARNKLFQVIEHFQITGECCEQ